MNRAEQNRAAAVTATVVAAMMIAQQIAAKAIRDSFFLSNWSAETLPLVMAGSALLTAVVVLGLTRLLVRYSPARVVPGLFALHGLLYACEWALADVQPRLAAVVVYAHSTALGATVISGFWSVINERFDPHSAKKLITRITGGATAGGVLGGIIAWQSGRYLELPAMLIVLTGLSLVCAVGLLRVTRARPAIELDGKDSPSGFAVLREVPYLRTVAVLVITATAVEACVDYLFKASAKSTFPTDDLITFFAFFHAAVATATFLMQMSLARRVLAGLGLTGTVAALPGINLVGSAIAMALPGLWPLAGLRGAAMSVENSLFRSGYELLYTPLSLDRKRPTKLIIDVGADRLGAMLGSGLALGVIWLAPEQVRLVLLSVAALITLGTLLVTTALHRGYVSALADGLRQGAVSLAEDAVEDATTRRAMTDTAMAIDLEKLLAQIEELRRGSGESRDMPAIRPVPSTQPVDHGGELDALACLLRGSAEDIRAVLSRYGDGLPANLVPAAIDLLARDDVHHEVIDALRAVAGRHTGQLVDALLDPETDFAIRRRVPRVLGRVPTQRSVDGLMGGLADARFEVRYRCGLALYQIAKDEPAVTIDPERIFVSARKEAEHGEHVWRSQKLLDATLEEGTPFIAEADKVGRSLEHVFTILSIVLETETLLLAYRALASGDDNLRGTGLEYLENVLPEDIRDVLWPFLGDRRVMRAEPRAPEVVVKDLLKSMKSMAIDVDEVRRQQQDDESKS